jgi:predicted Zn-ribbon and HTH transcriptional regulator
MVASECPACHSPNIGPARGMRGNGWYECRDCGYQWKP